MLIQFFTGGISKDFSITFQCTRNISLGPPRGDISTFSVNYCLTF